MCVQIIKVILNLKKKSSFFSNNPVENDWADVFRQEIGKKYFQDLKKSLSHEYLNYQCFPPENQIFHAFNLCSFENTKVVILGQDPYHSIEKANGLCFSVSKGISCPPSLKNIIKELNNDIGQSQIIGGDLSIWANQGVLLLNSVLTVRQNEANSHKNLGWEKFTDYVIKSLNEHKSNLVFLLWGNNAIKKGKNIDNNKHLVLTASHPSPLSANRGGWFGNNHFSKTNDYLQGKNIQPIKW